MTLSHCVMLVALGLCFLGSPGREVWADGSLEAIRAAVRTPDAVSDEEESGDGKSRKGKSGRRGLRLGLRHDDCDDEGWLEDSLSKVFFYVVTSPFWVPPSILGDDYQPGHFAEYPYAARHAGFMMIEPDVWGKHWDWSVRATALYGTDFDDVSQVLGRVQWDGPLRFGVDTEFRQVEERLDSMAEDRLQLGDFNVVYRFAQSRRVQMRSGIGVNWMHDADDTDYGFNFTYGGDWFPDDPFVVSTDFDWGRLGDASAIHSRVTGGVVLRNLEAFVGYDYLRIGDTRLRAMLAGVRVWF